MTGVESELFELFETPATVTWDLQTAFGKIIQGFMSHE